MSTQLEDTQPKSPFKTGQIPVAQPPPNRGCGCFVVAIVTALVVSGLVIVGLFLPPINLYDRLFGTPYAILSAENNAVRSVDQALTIFVSPDDPGDDFGIALNTISDERFLAGTAAGEWVSAARAALPPNLALQSNVYSIATTGKSPKEITMTVALPTEIGSTDILDLYSYNPATGKWHFLASQPNTAGTLTAVVTEIPAHLALFQAAPSAPVIWSAVDITQRLSPEVAQIASIIAPAGMQPTLQGTLAGSLAPGFDVNAAYRVMPVIRNFADPRAIDPDTVTALLNNRSTRAEHVRQITAFSVGGNYDGVFIDYRDLAPEQRENFSAFIRELSKSLAESGRILGVVVPAATNENGVWNSGAYDWRIIGANAEYVSILLDINPRLYETGPDRPIDALLRWAVGEISRYKILIGLSALSVREANGVFSPIGYDEALSALGNVVTEPDAQQILPPGTEIRARLDGFNGVSGTDTLVRAPFIDYQTRDGAPVARMWLTSGSALRFRLDKTVPFLLGGTAFNDLLASGVAEDVLESILSYKLQLPSTPSSTELALHWRIQGASGLIDEVVTGLNETLVVTVTAPDGNYAINVAVVGAELESARSGAAVAVFAPTSTPTPLPTSTPTPLPTITPTPVPVVPTATGAPIITSGNPNPVPPPSGSIGAFEYGGHVTTGATSAAGAMKSAGMTWMKVQLRYYLGSNPAIAAPEINAAHANGFKVLLGIVGQPAELAAGGAGYVKDFANFLGGVAALGPDAIEVWNEPNLSREWPAGQISGAAYAEMLKQAYQAIKSANSSVMVISGAPAPTGAESLFPNEVMNDDRWLREVVAAGGLNAMDCLGIHYNEGIVGPGQTGGDPRDNYYTRYFWGMVNTYWSIGGGKPLCFTELGYLTPEGFPPLTDFFSWASGVTLAQQAAWLAEAAALSSQSGKVRMMIIWNIDFTVYGSDPQAGYAIIRPGGGCPACNTLAAAR